jgi:hypothetical protein
MHFVNQFTSNRVKIVRRKITQLVSTWCCERKNKLPTYNVATNKVAMHDYYLLYCQGHLMHCSLLNRMRFK